MAKFWLVIAGLRFAIAGIRSVIAGIQSVIAGLTRNPVYAWHWIPDRVRDDNSRVRNDNSQLQDDKPQLRDDIVFFVTAMSLRGPDTTHRHLGQRKALVVAGARHQYELQTGTRRGGAGTGQRKQD